MPKVKSDKNKNSGPTKIKLKGGKPGAFFYLYHSDAKAPVALGPFEDDKKEFVVPAHYSGKAILKVNIPQRNRRGGSPIGIMKEIKLNHGPMTFDLGSDIKSQEKEGKTTNLENDLRESVQEKKQAIKKTSQEEKEEKVLKRKFLFNKLGELVQAREEEVAEATK